MPRAISVFPVYGRELTISSVAIHYGVVARDISLHGGSVSSPLALDLSLSLTHVLLDSRVNGLLSLWWAKRFDVRLLNQ